MLGKGDPNVPLEFFELESVGIRNISSGSGAGPQIFQIKNTRDFPDFGWLINANVTIDGIPYKVLQIESWVNRPVPVPEPKDKIGAIIEIMASQIP